MTRRKLFTLVLVVQLVFAVTASGKAQETATPAAPVTAETGQSDWNNFKGDAGRRGVADAGPTGQPVELWRAQAGGACNPSPSVVAGVVYAPCLDGVVYALDAATGEERWRYTASAPPGEVTVADGL